MVTPSGVTPGYGGRRSSSVPAATATVVDGPGPLQPNPVAEPNTTHNNNNNNNQEDENHPQQQQQKQQGCTKTSAWTAYLHLVKGTVGPGCLSLPWAVSQLGPTIWWWPGCLCILVVALWTSYNCHTVVALADQYSHHHSRCRRHTSHNSNNHHHHESINTNNTMAVTYPMLSRWLVGPRLERTNVACMLVQQLAICTVFLSFVTTNLLAIGLSTHTDDDAIERRSSLSGSSSPGQQEDHYYFYYYAGTLTLVALLCGSLAVSLPNLQALAPLTSMGTGLLLTGLGLLGVVVSLALFSSTETTDNDDTNTDPLLTTDNRHHSSSWLDSTILRRSMASQSISSSSSSSSTTSFDWTAASLAFCALLYAFEGICLVLPVRSSMRQPESFPTTFAAAMVTVSIVFSVVAASCVAAFGPITQGSITAFLLQKYSDDSSSNSDNHPAAAAMRLEVFLVRLANAAVSLSVLVTYPLQLFPCLELWGSSSSSSPSRQLVSVPSTELAPKMGNDYSSTQQRQTSSYESELFLPLHETTGNYSAEMLVRPTQEGEAELVPKAPEKALLEKRKLAPHKLQGLRINHNDHHTYDSLQTKAFIERVDGVRLNYSERSTHSIKLDPIAPVPVFVSSRERCVDPVRMFFHQTWTTTLARKITLVLITYVAALVIPHVETLIALAGALAGSSTALLIPPVLQLAYLRRHQHSLDRNRHNHVDDGTDGEDEKSDDDDTYDNTGIIDHRYNSALMGPYESFTSVHTKGSLLTIAMHYLLLLGGIIFLFIGTAASIRDIVRIYVTPGV